MSNILRQAWAAAAAPHSSSRFVHMFLPDDPDEAYRALVTFARPGRSADQINPPGPHAYDKNRFHDLVANGGFSSHPWRNGAPTHGFMASYDDPEGKGFGQVHDLANMDPGHIAHHRLTITPHLREKGAYQGGWLDRGDNKVYLDLSHHFNSENQVRKFALENRQKAYFDLHDFSEKYLDPHQDPQFMHDRPGWTQKYDKIVRQHGLAAPEQYESYRHLYPDPPELEEHRQQHLSVLTENEAQRRRMLMRVENGYFG